MGSPSVPIGPTSSPLGSPSAPMTGIFSPHRGDDLEDLESPECQGSFPKKNLPNGYVCPRDLQDSTYRATGVLKPSQQDVAEESEVGRTVCFSRDGSPLTELSSSLSSPPPSPSRSQDEIEEDEQGNSFVSDAMKESAGPNEVVEKDEERGVPMEGVEKGCPDVSQSHIEQDEGRGVCMEGVEKGCPEDVESQKVQDEGRGVSMEGVEKSCPKDVELQKAQDEARGVSMEAVENGLPEDVQSEGDKEDERDNPTVAKSMNGSSASKQVAEEGRPADAQADESRHNKGGDAMQSKSMEDQSNDAMDVDRPDAEKSHLLGPPFELRRSSRNAPVRNQSNIKFSTPRKVPRGRRKPPAPKQDGIRFQASGIFLLPQQTLLNLI